MINPVKAIKLLQPLTDEVGGLLRGQRYFRGNAIVEGALPPKVILDQSRYLLSSAPLAYRWSVPFLIVAPDERRVVGNIGGKGLLNGDDEIELGYNVARTYRGRGIASRAIAVISTWALADGLVPLAHVEPHNEASRRALLSNGYRLDCRVSMPAGFVLDRYRYLAH